MLNEQDEKDMLADAHSATRREDFRRAKALQQGSMSGKDYLAFLDDVARMFPHKRDRQTAGQNFKL